MDVIGWDWLSRMGWAGARRAGVDVGALSILSTHLSGLMRHWSIEPFIYGSGPWCTSPCLDIVHIHVQHKAVCVDVSCNFEMQMCLWVDGCLIYIYFERWAVISLNGRFTMMSTMKTHYALLMKTRLLFCKCDWMIIQISFRLWFLTAHLDLLQFYWGYTTFAAFMHCSQR